MAINRACGETGSVLGNTPARRHVTPGTDPANRPAQTRRGVLLARGWPATHGEIDIKLWTVFTEDALRENRGGEAGDAVAALVVAWAGGGRLAWR